MNYFKRNLEESRDDEFDNWGKSTFFLETDDLGYPNRQIEQYQNGVVLKYDKEKAHDEFGMLGDQKIDLDEFAPFQITNEQFSKEWNTKTQAFVVSQSLGILFQDSQFEDWWESIPKQVPLLNETLKFTFMDLIPEGDNQYLEDADAALQNFLAKDESDRNQISELTYQHCLDFLNAVDYGDEDGTLRNLKDRNDIWDYVYPKEILVARRDRRDEDIYINISCECEWEKEHGLQLVFRQGKRLTRISEQDGHLTEADAYDKPDKEDKLLNQFNKAEKGRPWWKF